MIKKIIAIALIVVVTLAMLLFGMQKISLAAFWVTLIVIGLIAWLGFKRK